MIQTWPLLGKHKFQVNPIVGWLVGWLAGWLVGRSVGWPVAWIQGTFGAFGQSLLLPPRELLYDPEAPLRLSPSSRKEVTTSLPVWDGFLEGH